MGSLRKEKGMSKEQKAINNSSSSSNSNSNFNNNPFSLLNHLDPKCQGIHFQVQLVLTSLETSSQILPSLWVLMKCQDKVDPNLG